MEWLTPAASLVNANSLVKPPMQPVYVWHFVPTVIPRRAAWRELWCAIAPLKIQR
jgi:hypothetical protein